MLAPRMNAAGRLGQASLAIELLTTESPDRAKSLAEYLNELNGSRESLERSIYLAANKMAKDFDPRHDAALVLADRGWHPGVIGIVASRLAEKYHCPVALVALANAISQADYGIVLCTSPTIVDGRLYVRRANAVACYDLRSAP